MWYVIGVAAAAIAGFVLGFIVASYVSVFEVGFGLARWLKRSPFEVL